MSSNDSAMSAALAFISSAYAVVETPKVEIKASGKASRVKGTALPNSGGAIKATRDAKGEATSVESIARKAARPILTSSSCERFPLGTIDAANFLYFFRRTDCPVSGANWPEVAIGKDAKGEPIFSSRGTPAMQRDRRIALIAGFVGYDDSLSYVANETRAKDAAKRKLYPNISAAMEAAPSRAENRSASLTAEGWIAGLPNGTRKIVLDLLSRERLAVSELSALVKVINDPSSTPHEVTQAEGLSLLETERLAIIRADLRRYV